MTCSALIYREEFIVVASDSAVVDGYGERSRSLCKIVPAGDCFYVPNGMAEDPASGYNLYDIIEKIGPLKSPDALAEDAKREIEKSFVAALTMRRQTGPVRFRQNVRGENVLGISFVGLEGGRPSWVHFHFDVEDLEAQDIRLKFEVHRCTGKGCPDGTVVLVGPDDLKVRFMKDSPDYYKGSVDDVLKNAKTFVQMAIDLGMPNFGPPISSLIVTPDRVQLHAG